MSAASSHSITHLSGDRAAKLDEELMGDSIGYTLEQLMELAGLACAQAVQSVYPVKENEQARRVLVVCGPGNNGGDGLVAARHLCLFGYAVRVLYPKEPKKDFYKALLKQLAAHKVPVLSEWPSASAAADAHLIVDAIFGFSFDPADGIREPYKGIIARIVEAQKATPAAQVASIDVPSGWDVSKGDTASTGLVPNLLISLTAPKECAAHFQGRHVLGGRFVPADMLQRLSIQLPPYSGASQIQDITSAQGKQ